MSKAKTLLALLTSDSQFTLFLCELVIVEVCRSVELTVHGRVQLVGLVRVGEGDVEERGRVQW